MRSLIALARWILDGWVLTLMDDVARHKKVKKYVRPRGWTTILLTPTDFFSKRQILHPLKLLVVHELLLALEFLHVLAFLFL